MPSRDSVREGGVWDAAPLAGPPSALILPPLLRAAIVDQLRRCLPQEGVGLLGVVAAPDGWRGDRYYPGQNADASPRRYTMDPADILPALRDMERRRTRLGAVVHSHPRTAPMPSQTDLAEARWPGVLSVIVGFEPVVDIRAWALIFGPAGYAIGSKAVRVVASDGAEAVAGRRESRRLVR